MAQEADIELPDRQHARRRYATSAGAMAVVLLAGGPLAVHDGGSLRAIGVIALGCGIGVAVAAVFLALGHDPRRRM